MSTLALRSARETLADRLLARSLLTDVVLIAAGAGLTSILAQVAIPLWPVLGIVGLPVFSGHESGIGVIGGFGGGYIIGFVFSAAVVGWIGQSNRDHKIGLAILSALAGTVVTLVFGLVWLWATLGMAGYPNDVNSVLTGGLYNFIVGGIVKAAIAGLVVGGAWWVIDRNDRQRAGKTDA